MRKKQIGRVLILFVLTLFVLCSCTGGGESKEPYVTNGRGASSGKTGTSGTGNSADTGNGADDDGTLMPISLVYTEHEKTFTLDEKGKAETVLEIGFVTLKAKGDAPEAVTAYLETFSNMKEKRVRDSVLEDSQELYLSYSGAWGSWYDGMYWSASQVFHADRADTAVLSFAIENVSYMGGAHGARWFEAYSIDAKTGDDIRFSSVVKDRVALADALYTQMKQDENFERVCEYYDGAYGTPDMGFAERYLEYYLTDDEGGSVTWTLAPEGLHVWFGDYELGAYAMGTGDIVVPFADYPEVFAGNDYTNPGEEPEAPDKNVQRESDGKQTVDLREYCREEGSFMLGTFSDVCGVYASGGKMIELTEYGTYFLTGAEGESVSGGLMRYTQGSIELYDSNYETDPDRTWEERHYGSIALIDGTEIDVTTPDGTERYVYHIEQSAARGYISAPNAEISLSEEEMDGDWYDTVSGTRISLYAWRGEFDVSIQPMGDYYVGDFLYNGDSVLPRYTLVTEDGYNLAEFYFLETNWDEPEMVITFHFAESDQTLYCYKAQG